MPLIPETVVGKIEFFENHMADWVANSVAIGSSAAEITALQTKVTNARAAYLAQQVAQESAKSKTLTLRDDVTLMMNAGSDVIKKIRAKAATDGNTIYTLANIPAPATPTPVPAPGTPFGLKVGLKPNGSVELKWKCNNPANGHGTIYTIYRRIGGTGEFTFIGGSGVREWVDTSLPAGVASVTYSIQGVRSTAVGDAAEFIVNFGVVSGAMSATVTDGPTTAPKMAA
jgi:hypothetical protein